MLENDLGPNFVRLPEFDNALDGKLMKEHSTSTNQHTLPRFVAS